MIRLLAIDIDGTLVNSEQRTDARRFAGALRRAQAAGIQVVLGNRSAI